MIQLPENWQTALNNARVENKTPLWSSVEADGQPSIAYYGSTHAHSDHEIALWMRTSGRGFLRRIEANPKVTMLYNDPTPETRLTLLVHGEAKRITDPALAKRIYDESPEVERTADANMEGVAVLVDIVRIIQRGEIVQSRDGDVGKAAD